jgi:DNA polymerase
VPAESTTAGAVEADAHIEPALAEAAQVAFSAARDALAAPQPSPSLRPRDLEPTISDADQAALSAARDELAARRESASRPTSSAPVEPAPAPPASARPDGVGDAANRALSLRVLRDDIGDCTRCPLHTGRTELVFGAGRPTARLMMVADGPGPAEDETGLPFVDEAGRLLSKMIRAMGLRRADVYLTYLVKCRTPGIHPEAGLEPCADFLARQVSIVQPEVIIALGDLAARRVTGRDEAFPRLRGQWLDYRGIPVLPTFHPIALLQNPRSKGLVWADLKSVMRRMGLKQPRRG